MAESMPEFWVTTLAKLLAGEQPCELPAWLFAHTDVKKRERDDQGALAKWKAEHSEQLHGLVEELRAAGWRVQKERYFRIKGQVAVLAGKADAITQADGRRPKIWDVKSGKPRDSDVTQVLIEMAMIPVAWEAPTMQFDGCVVYPDHRVELKPQQAADLKPKMVSVLKRVATMPRPEPMPSRDACRFCEVPESECAVRFKFDEPDAETKEF